jgi:hypothetical protein
MKKLLILSLLFMGCDIEIADHTHDYAYEHTHDDVVHTHDFSEVNHTHDPDDSSYELLAWAFRQDGLTCLRVGENQCTNYENNGGFDEPLVTVDVQEIRIYDGERYMEQSPTWFIVQVTYVNGTVVKIPDVLQFGYLED